MTLHELIADLTNSLDLTPEQQFRVAAKIKRYVHDEKTSVYHRLFLYSQGPGIFDKTDPDNYVLIGREPAKDVWLNGILEGKYKQHAEWARMPDEEVITYSIGNFKYIQKVQPCSVCGEELTGKSYTSTLRKGVYNTFCQAHAPKEEV